MPSRSNPNVPSKSKPKTAKVLKNKRKNTQRLANSKINKNSVPRTSQALRQNAALSRKKARKLDKKGGYASKRRELERFMEAEVEMRDVDEGATKTSVDAKAAKPVEKME
ncbi:MAG: hypothetical protein Q9183_002554, partial [Haloplaca sp. 2 TL-2023]